MIDSQNVIFCIRTKLKPDDGEALRNVLASRAVLRNRMAQARRSLPDTTSLVAGFDANVAVAEARQSERVISSDAYEDGTETDSTNSQQCDILDSKFVISRRNELK